MSERIEIKASEQGVVRLFDVDLGPDEAKAFNRRNGSWPLRDALGAETLEPNHVDLFQVGDLAEVGLAGYLAEGLGIAPEEVDKHRAAIDALDGTVMIVTSRAFGGTAQTLEPRAPLRLVGTFREDRAPVQFDPLPSDTAKGEVNTAGRNRPSDASMSGRVAVVALLVLFLLVAVVIWLA